MKIKYAVRMFLPVAGILTIAGCAGKFPFGSQSLAEVIVGEVSLAGSDSILIQVGIQAEADEDGNIPALELTGEEQEISLTKDTVIRLQEAGMETDQEMESSQDAEENPEELSSEEDAEENPEESSSEGDPEENPEEPSSEGDPEENPEEPSSEGDPEENPEELSSEGKPKENAEEPSSEENPEENPEESSSEENPEENPEESSSEENPEEDPEENPGEPSGEESEEPAGEELSAADLRKGDIVSVSLDKKGNPLEILVISRGQPDPAGQAREAEDYNAATEFAVDIETDGEVYTSAGTDENAVHVFGEAQVLLRNARVTRTSRDSNGGSFARLYGVGAALLTTNGISYIKDSAITTNASGGAGIFSYGNGTAYVMNTEVATMQDTSGGIHAAGGGTLYAWNLDIKTEGNSSAAITSDQGGGTMVVDGGSYITRGEGSPAVYCMADIAVRGGTLTADASEAVCIEGRNSLHLYDCELTGNMGDDLDNDSAWNVLIYQRTTDDSQAGSSTFEMNGGSLTLSNGGIFYTTNTESVITLSNVKIIYPEVRDFFLKCTGNDYHKGWGEAGANGADCLFTAASQDMEGDIIWDSISQLDFYMKENSTLKGAVLNDKSNADADQNGYCNLYIEEGCTWTVTGDSTVSRISCKGKLVDDEGNQVTIRGTDGTVYVQGSGKYTITVNSYETAVNLSGASEMTRWMDHQAAIPEAF